jgi:putative hemin transport protein
MGDVLTRLSLPKPAAGAATRQQFCSCCRHCRRRLVDQEWRAMTDVHQFFGLLKRHNLTRQQAFRLVGDDLACKVSNSALAQLLDTARQDGNEIMVFVGNRGCVQIFTGVWKNWCR